MDAEADKLGPGVAFTRLVEAQQFRLRALARHFGIPAAELDDAVQEVFARAWEGLAAFRSEADLSTWLIRIAVNHFTSRRQAMGRWRRLFVQKADTLGEYGADSAAFERSETCAEARALALESINRLPVKLRRAFVLHYVEGMSCREAAKVLGIPEATVRTRLYNARVKLRHMLRGYEL
jgi:RNA polymerase sigma-70 factor, ECF subfamily